MSRMQIYVFFDQPEENYRCGDTVTGRIKITAYENTRIEQLKVTPMWRTHGRGNKAQGKLTTMKLFSGTWHQGETYEYFFAFDTPLTPHTYEGELVNVDWFLHIHPDVPFELDDKPEERFSLKPALDNPLELPKASGCSKAAPWFSGLFMLPFIGIGLFLIMMAMKMILEEEFAGIFIFLVASVFVIAPGFILYKVAKNMFANFMLGNITLRLEPGKVAPGEPFKLHLSCKPRWAVSSLTLQSHLRTEEEATSGSGTDVTTYNHKIVDEDQEKVFANSLKSQQPFTHTFELVLPDITPATLHLKDNSVKTAVHLKLRTDRFTWEGAQEIIVRQLQ